MKILTILLLFFSSITMASTYTVDKITQLEINSSINPATLNYIKTNITKASQGEVILIKLNTPGGLVSTTKDIMTDIGASKVPIIIWVYPEGASATSAGAIIASSAHILLMGQGTNIGAATPIGLGKDIEQADARNKAINDLVANVSALSELRNRNADAFSKMISEAKSYTANEALKLKIIDSIVSSDSELIKFLDQRNVKVGANFLKLSLKENVQFNIVEMDAGQALLDILANPSFAYILFMLGAALLYFEFQAPGGFIAGGLGVGCLIFAGIGFQVLPLNFGSFGLIVLAFVLFVMEIYITSYGLLSLAGLASLIAGSLFLFRSDDGYLELQTSMILSTVSAVVLIMGSIAYMFYRDSKRDKSSFDIANKHGHVSKLLEFSRYQIKVSGEIWNAICEESLDIGDEVVVVEQLKNELTLKVKKV